MSVTSPETDLNVIQPDDGYNQLHIQKEKSEALATSNPFTMQDNATPLSPPPIVHKALTPPKLNFQAHTNSPDISVTCQRNDPMKTKLKQMNQNVIAKEILSQAEIKDDCSSTTKETVSRKKDNGGNSQVPIIFRAANEDYIFPYEMALNSSREKACYDTKACCAVF